MVLEPLFLIEKMLNKTDFVMKLRKGLILILCYLIASCSINLNAQKINSDLKKMAIKYKSDFKMDVEMNITYWDLSKSKEVSKGNVKRKGNNYYSNFEGRINLKNQHYNLIITENDKHIIYIPITSINKKNNHDLLPDSNLYEKSIKLIKSDKYSSHYEISNPIYGMVKIQLEVTKTNILKKVKYFYQKSEESPIKEIVITYKNVVFNPIFSTDDFSEKKYFSIVNNKLQPTPNYKGYKLIKAG